MNATHINKPVGEIRLPKRGTPCFQNPPKKPYKAFNIGDFENLTPPIAPGFKFNRHPHDMGRRQNSNTKKARLLTGQRNIFLAQPILC